jgi:hypothetical protein
MRDGVIEGDEGMPQSRILSMYARIMSAIL